MEFLQILVYLCLCYTFINGEDESNTLFMVHVLFRHGDRTPTYKSMYPNDPYRNETYYPYGKGELTNEGKRTQYNLGVNLHNRYKKFLGEIFHPDIFWGMSTRVARTQTSMQCVLAGLFPPKGPLIWNNLFKWQPIAYASENNEYMSAHLCEYSKLLMQEYQNTSSYHALISKYQTEFQYISEHAGVTYTNVYQAYKLFCVLVQQDAMGYKLPEWTTTIYPMPLRLIAAENYFHYCGTDQLKRMNTGYLVRKIIMDTKQKICGNLYPPNRKIFVYSGHQLNVACLLHTLGIFDLHMPFFGAHVTVEVHKIKNIYGFKIFYQNKPNDPLEIRKLDDCEEFCPFKKFISLYREYIPTEDWCTTPPK